MPLKEKATNDTLTDKIIAVHYILWKIYLLYLLQ